MDTKDKKEQCNHKWVYMESIWRKQEEISSITYSNPSIK